MSSKLFPRSGLIKGLIILFLLISTIIVFYFLESRLVHQSARGLSKNQEVMFRSEKLLSLLTEAETGARAYLLTGNEFYKNSFNRSKDELPGVAKSLNQLVAENPQQVRFLDTLNQIGKSRLIYSDSVIRLKSNISTTEAILVVTRGNSVDYLNKIRLLSKKIQELENSFMENAIKTNRQAAFWQYTLSMLIIVILILLLLLLFIKEKKAAGTRFRQKSEEIYQGLLEAAPDAMIVLNRQAKIVLVNKQTETLFGYSRNQLSGQDAGILVPDTCKLLKFSQGLRDAGENAPFPMIRSRELTGRKINGDIFPVEISASGVQAEKEELIFVSVRDITERIEAQKRIDSLVKQIDQANDAIYILDEEYCVKSWNMGAYNLYGYTEEEALGKNSFQLLHVGQDKELYDKAIAEIARLNYWKGDLKRYNKSGNEIYVHNSVTTIRDQQEKITGYVVVGHDISAERKLGERVSHLASIVEESSEAIVSRNAQSQISSWNKGAENMFGYTRDEVIGKSAWEVGLIRFPPSEMEELEKAIKKQGSWRAEKKMFHKNGTMIYGAITANALKDENGQVNHMVFIIKDISLQKELELALQKNNEALELKLAKRTEEILKSEKRFRALLENNYDIISLLDSSFKLIYRSPSANRITGWSNEELIGKNGIDNIHPDDIPMAKGIVQELMNSPGKAISCSFRNLHKDGHYQWLEGIVTNLLENENVRAIVFNFRDITQRKITEEKLWESEIHFRETLDQMLEGIQIIGFDWRYQYVNDSMAKHGKYGKDEFVGRTVMEMYPGIEETPIYTTYLKCFRERVSIHLENEFTFPDGSVSWFELSFQPVPQGIFILSVDITERKHAEQKIIQLNADLEMRVSQRTDQLVKTNQELEAFSYSVSHDLRAPLRAILGFATILEEDYSSKLDEEAMRITGVIKNNTIRMGTLIDDLLGFSRMSRHEIIKTNISMNGLIRDIIADTISMSANKTIDWVLAPLPEVYADPSTIRQVWINLISNAVKYSRNEEHPRIEIGSQVRGNETEFYIKDNGVGFDEKYKEKLFKVFQRLHRHEEFEGTGVGLAIVEKIISKHGGRIGASSVKGEGANFYFTLPPMETNQ